MRLSETLKVGRGNAAIPRGSLCYLPLMTTPEDALTHLWSLPGRTVCRRERGGTELGWGEDKACHECTCGRFPKTSITPRAVLPTDACLPTHTGGQPHRTTNWGPSEDKSGSASVGRVRKHPESIPTGVKKEELHGPSDGPSNRPSNGPSNGPSKLLP